MPRQLHDQSNPRNLFGGLWAVALTGLTWVACQHSQAVQDLAENAKKISSTGGTGNVGGATNVGGAGNVANSGGTDDGGPTSLDFTVADLGEDAFTGEPVVDEENRTSCGDTEISDTYIPDPAIQEEARSLLSQLTIDQKMWQLTGIASPDYNDGSRWEDIQRSRDVEALNLRGYRWRDGPHGLNLEAGRGRNDLQNYATSFPTSVAQGATFDMDLVSRVGQAMGDETLASSNNVLLAPCMNVLRHPFWGRAQETFGEDTFHLGRIGTALVQGIQQHITGCAKHYTGNNIEDRRWSINAQMDEQTLREVYGRHFEMVVRDGGVGCVMAAYNSVNGTKSTQNRHTLTNILRDDMRFKGFVLTDWWAMPGADFGQGPVEAPQDRKNPADLDPCCRHLALQRIA